MEHSIEELERIMSDGFAEVACTECGDYARIEPDADYECPNEGCEGKVTSPLILEGLI